MQFSDISLLSSDQLMLVLTRFTDAVTDAPPERQKRRAAFLWIGEGRAARSPFLLDRGGAYDGYRFTNAGGRWMIQTGLV